MKKYYLTQVQIKYQSKQQSWFYKTQQILFAVKKLFQKVSSQILANMSERYERNIRSKIKFVKVWSFIIFC